MKGKGLISIYVDEYLELQNLFDEGRLVDEEVKNLEFIDKNINKVEFKVKENYNTTEPRFNNHLNINLYYIHKFIYFSAKEQFIIGVIYKFLMRNNIFIFDNKLKKTCKDILENMGLQTVHTSYYSKLISKLLSFDMIKKMDEDEGKNVYMFNPNIVSRYNLGSEKRENLIKNYNKING